MGEFFPKFWENTKFFPNFSDKFVPKIGESPNLSSNFGTNSSPNLVNPQISPQLSGQIRPQIWWFPKFVLKFGEIFFPKFGESPNLGMNSSLTMSQKADEHSSNIHDVWTTHTWAYLIFVIFLHEQNFWRIEFTPKNAKFSHWICKKRHFFA